jgi:hypothetical protein
VINTKNLVWAVLSAQGQRDTGILDRRGEEFAPEQQRNAANDFIFHHS